MVLMLSMICFISYGQGQEWDDVKVYYFKVKLENNEIHYIKKTLPPRVKYKRISEPMLVDGGWGFDKSKDLAYKKNNLQNVILKKNVLHFKMISKVEYNKHK